MTGGGGGRPGLNWSEIAAKAAEETERQLAADMSSLTTMTAGEIDRLFATR